MSEASGQGRDLEIAKKKKGGGSLKKFHRSVSLKTRPEFGVAHKAKLRNSAMCIYKLNVTPKILCVCA